tara:strand:- start:363 stop:527 length:165 start_codon:yes stop_codon:yes gene_type:complete
LVSPFSVKKSGVFMTYWLFSMVRASFMPLYFQWPLAVVTLFVILRTSEGDVFCH